MPPLLDRSSWNLRDESAGRKPKGRCFLIAEGANTEFWYLERLSAVLAKRNLPKRIDMVPIERTDGDMNKSSPRALLDQVRCVREDERFGFDESIDFVVVVFDTDIYQRNPKQYIHDLQELCRVARVAVTSPSFELFLLLHLEDSFESIIEPHAEEILKNGHWPGSHRRYVDVLVSKTFNMNPKTNRRIADLAEQFDIAAKQEVHLNQDSERALYCLTSNIAKTIVDIITEAEVAS